MQVRVTERGKETTKKTLQVFTGSQVLPCTRHQEKKAQWDQDTSWYEQDTGIKAIAQESTNEDRERSFEKRESMEEKAARADLAFVLNRNESKMV